MGFEKNKLKPKEEIGKGLNKEHYKKVEESRRKTITLPVRMSISQKSKLELDAKNEGMNVSKYVRTKLGLV